MQNDEFVWTLYDVDLVYFSFATTMVCVCVAPEQQLAFRRFGPIAWPNSSDGAYWELRGTNIGVHRAARYADEISW